MKLTDVSTVHDGVFDALGQHLHVREAQVQPLAGEGVNSVRSITDEHRACAIAFADVRVRMVVSKWEAGNAARLNGRDKRGKRIRMKRCDAAVVRENRRRICRGRLDVVRAFPEDDLFRNVGR
jgi:hypothetical protein